MKTKLKRKYPSWFNKYYAPSPPKPPNKTLIENEYLFEGYGGNNGDTFTIEKDIPAGATLCLDSDISYGYYDNQTVEMKVKIYIPKEVENLNYDTEFKKYQKKLEAYNKRLKEWQKLTQRKA